MFKYTSLLILLLMSTLSEAKKSKRIFDYDFSGPREIQTPNSQVHNPQIINQTEVHQAAIGESKIHQIDTISKSNLDKAHLAESQSHKPNLSEKSSITKIDKDFMGNFPELIGDIDSAINLMNNISSTGQSAQPIEINKQQAYESSTPEIKIFDNNQ